MDTELLQQQLDKKHPWNFRKIRADLVIKVKLKKIKKEAFVCIIVEHKSVKGNPFKVFSQVVDYNMALIGSGECPVLTIVIYHGEESLGFPTDLKTYCGWTPEMREIFGDSGLNCVLDVLDLNKSSEEALQEGGVLTPCYLALKSIWFLTREKVRSIFKASWDGQEF